MALQEEDVQISILENESEHYHSNVELNGILTLNPKQEKKGIVIFAHGSGSGRDSPRNQYVASVLNNQSGIVTLLVDLLSSEEQEIDEKTKEYRFNIKLAFHASCCSYRVVTSQLSFRNSEYIFTIDGLFWF